MFFFFLENTCEGLVIQVNKGLIVINLETNFAQNKEQVVCLILISQESKNDIISYLARLTAV